MSRNLRLGHIDLSFHSASAAVVQTILERDGHTVELSAAPHERMFKRYGRAEVDLLVSAWLPASHGAYLAPHLQATRKLGVLYRPYCVWGVPEYVPESAVSQVSDLLKPEILARMERRIQGINPGAGISRFSEAMVQAYGLAGAGYHFRPGTEAECFDGYEQAVREGTWVVLPLWHPQYLHYRYRIRTLLEPKHLLGGADEATLIVRREAEPLIRASTLQTLAQLQLSNDVVTMLDYRICKEGQSPRQAASDWLNSTGAMSAAG
jgi:glycine betaine/proline transport system substrate-binding protein